jgi:hypothetical protein
MGARQIDTLDPRRSRLVRMRTGRIISSMNSASLPIPTTILSSSKF